MGRWRENNAKFFLHRFNCRRTAVKTRRGTLSPNGRPDVNNFFLRNSFLLTLWARNPVDEFWIRIFSTLRRRQQTQTDQTRKTSRQLADYY